MTGTVAGCLRLLAVGIMLITARSASTNARAADSTSPVTTADAVRSQFFLAHGALLGDDTDSAQAAVRPTRDAADVLIEGFGAESPAGQSLSTALAASDTAAGQNHPIGLAAARGQVWTAILAGAMQATVSSVQSGDLTGASA